MLYNGLQLRNVGLFGAISCPLAIQVAEERTLRKPQTAPCFLRCCYGLVFPFLITK